MLKKTLAVRQLEEAGISFELRAYAVDESDLSAPTVAAKIGLEAAQTFKTLVTRSDTGEIVLACVPGDAELDLKALARCSGHKKMGLVPLREVQPLTGYIRGGVSPLGLKKAFTLYLDELAWAYECISISAGVRGLQILLSPQALQQITGAQAVSICRYE